MRSHSEMDSDFVSIVLADSTRIHTQLLAEALQNDRGLQVAATASNSEELLAAVTRVPIDVVVISNNLDDQPGHGTEVLREMRALRPRIKGVILLDTSKPQEVLECFRAGARGVFSKQERLESLCKCIRIVHEGQVWARSADLDHALEALAKSPLLRATNHRGIELLSARERQVIQHLAAGMSNREIAHALGLSPHTVKNYLFRVFDKLGVSSRTELLYLTMNNSQVQPPGVANEGGNSFSATIEAAEAGDPSAQLRLAEHFRRIRDSQNNDGQNKRGQNHDGQRKDRHISGTPPDSLSAYMWCLLAEKTAADLLEQIDVVKKSISRTMSPQQLEEAEARAATRLKSTKQSPAFVGGGQPQPDGPRNDGSISGGLTKVRVTVP